MNTPNLTPDPDVYADNQRLRRELEDRTAERDALAAKLDLVCNVLTIAQMRLEALADGVVAPSSDAVSHDPLCLAARYPRICGTWCTCRPAAPAEDVAAGSVVSTEGSARPRPHWTIELGAEEARRWVASEPQMTDAEKDAFRAQVEGSGHPHPHGDDDGHDGYMSTRCEEGWPGCVGLGCICRCHADQPGPGPWTGPRPTLSPPDTDAPDLDSPDLPSQGRPVRQVRINLRREGGTDVRSH